MSHFKLGVISILLAANIIYWLTSWHYGWVDRTWSEVVGMACWMAWGWLLRSVFVWADAAAGSNGEPSSKDASAQ